MNQLRFESEVIWKIPKAKLP